MADYFAFCFEEGHAFTTVYLELLPSGLIADAL